MQLPNRNGSASSILFFIIIIILLSLTPPLSFSDDTTAIEVDKTAPASNQAGIDKAPNEVPLINIVAPSAKGVSHNKFNKFGVAAKGVILNNSANVGKSQLGGMVYGNPNFQPNKKTARIVLNEVTGVTESRLIGATEMFGDKAEYILANPNGIIVSGGKFINTPRVTLTTGVPKIDEFGDIKSLEVKRGMVVINEQTFAGENLNSVEIIARAAKIEEAIRTGALRITAGTNSYDYNNKTSAFKSDSEADKPVVAIDSALLGGMYSGRVFLIVTEKGVGVNSADSPGADIEDVTITKNGDVVLKKDIAAKTDVKIEAFGDITQEGESIAVGNIDFSAAKNIEISGKAVSGDSTNLQAGNRITNYGLIGADKRISGNSDAQVNIKAANIENVGNIQSSGDLTTESATFTNKKDALVESGGDLIIAAFDSIENNKANIKSGGDLKLQGANNQNSNKITNKVGTIEAQRDITIKTDNLENIGEDKPSDYEKTVEISGTPDEPVKFAGGEIKKVHIGDYTWNKWGVMDEYQVESSLETTPAYLLSGGSINIYNANLYNYGSLISAGRDINIIGGSIKNETAAIRLKFDNYQLWGVKWKEKRKRNAFGGHYHVTLYDALWKSGEVIAKSANPAIIEAQGNINIETTEIANTDSAGFEPISTEKESKPVNEDPVTISYNKNIINKIKEFGISIKYNSDQTGFQTLGDFYGSHYFLSRINFNPDRALKKMLMLTEEAEARRVREAIFEATARRFLHKSVTTDAEQLRILMDNAVKANEKLEIALGVYLTPELIKALDEDIIWYVEEEINGVKVLVPRVYLSVSTLKSLENPQTIIKSGGALNIAATDDITNTGLIKSGENLRISGKNITNKTIGNGEPAEITADGDAALNAQNKIQNIGANIKSGKQLSVTTETGDITNQTQVNRLNFAGNIKSYAGQTASIESIGALIINSGANLINTGANINSAGDVIINAQKEITLGAIQLRNRDAVYFNNGHIISDIRKNIGSNLNAYGELSINAENIQIIASAITAYANVQITSANSLDITSAQDTNYFNSHIKKSGFFSSSKTTIIKSSSNNIGSQITSGGDLQITAQNQNINITGSYLTAYENANINTGANFNLLAGYNTNFYDKQTQKSGLFTGGALYSKEKTAQGSGSQKAVKSAITAKNLSITAGENLLLKGGDINAQNIDIQTGQNLLITSAPEQSYSYFHSEKTTFGVAGLLGGGFPGLNFEQGRLSLTLAKGEYDKQNSRTDKTEQNPSEIYAFKNINLASDNDLYISGSKLFAQEDINLAAKQDINITPTTETTQTNSKRESGEIELSVGVGNAYVDAGYAVSDTALAAKAVEQAKTRLSEIKKLKAQGKATDKAVRHAEANLAAAVTNMGLAAIKAAESVANAAGAASTSFGTGFYADLTLEAETTETKSERQTKTNLASQIKAGKNITILAGEDITHKGSITISMEGDITYEAGQNIEISASKDTDSYQSDTETKKASITIGSANPVAPAIDSIGGDIGYSEASQQTDSQTYNNSELIAEKGAINITTGANAQISGANLHSENINLNIGNNLSVESKQNSYESYGSSNNFNIGYNTANRGAIGGGYGKNNANRLWTDTQTSLIGTNSVNINVDGKTDITGALIANINNGEDTGNLFITTESLTYANLQDYDTSQESGFNLQLSDIKTEKDKKNKDYITGNAQVGIKNKGHEKEGETKATFGAGTIITGDNTDITALNREIAQTKIITKDHLTAALDLDANFDLRLLSEAGRQEILGEIINLPKNLNQIGAGLTNNIISQSIKNALTDGNKNIIDAANQYIADDKKIALIQQNIELIQALNGLTNLNPIYLQYALQNTADIAGSDGGFAGDLQLYALINSGKGYSYTDQYGNIIGVNTIKTDLANSGEIINLLFHETTNYADHSQNEQTAINRGTTAEAIWALKNFEKELANSKTTEDWNKENINNPIILYGNLLHNTADKNNILLFRFGKRPLGKPTWLDEPTLMNTLSDISDNTIIDYLNIELSHEHGFFEDESGDNIGFRDTGRFSEEPKELINLGYRYEDKYYDDDIMREALKNVKDWVYSSVINNCQDWADRLRKEYKKLEKEKQR